MRWGVLRVWEREDDEGDPIFPVEIVNLTNPMHVRRNPGTAAIREATPIGGDSQLRCVRLPYLMAMKLATTGRKDQSDVIELLQHNPDADVVEIREVCERYGLLAAFDDLLEP